MRRNHPRKPPARWFTVTAAVIALGLAGLLVLSLAAAVVTGRPGRTAYSVVVDRNGDIIATTGAESRIPVRLARIPKDLQDAVVAVEDERFFRHPGVDPIAIVRAIVTDLREGRPVQGGSTITQQVVKNLYLGPEKTLLRKLAEVPLAFYLEARLTKRQILQEYLNLAYLGYGAYGVEAASRLYFGKSAWELSLAQSATLAGVIRNPLAYSPVIHPAASRARRNLVLAKMERLGYISPDRAREAQSEALGAMDLRPGAWRTAAYYMEAALSEAATVLGSREAVYAGGLTIKTGLDLDMQRAAERAVGQGLLDLAPPPGAQREGGGPAAQSPEAALVAVDTRTGDIRALVGGSSFAATQFDRATKARRQPGSAFKPFVYAAAIDLGYTPETVMTCEPVTYYFNGQVYEPTDYGDEPYHWRSMTLRDALVVSCNVIAVRLNHDIGASRAASLAHRLGIESPLRANLSLALGTSEVSPIELAAAYCPFANGGYRVSPGIVKEIVSRSGKVLFRATVSRRRALDPTTAYLVTEMLKGVLRPGGTAGWLAGRVWWPAAGKTGSTQNLTDAWFVGYTPELCTAVYVGYDDPSVPLGVGGGVAAAPIWVAFMEGVLARDRRPPREFRVPPGAG